MHPSRDISRLLAIMAALRTPVTGVAGKVFQAVGVALPPNIRDANPAPVAA